MSHSNPSSDSVQILMKAVRTFVADRDWEQFHDVKNLALALSVEAGEVLEHCLWREGAELEEQLNSDPAKRRAFEGELGDVMMCLLGLFDRIGADPGASLLRKLEETAAKYPVEQARGRASKYSEQGNSGGN